MVKVALVECKKYDEETVKKALQEAFQHIGGLDRLVRPGSRVLLKVNMLSPKRPEDAVTTHPAVVKALAVLVKEAGGIPWVGDSSGGLLARQAPTGRAFEVTGIRKAAEEAGAEVINFDTAGVVEKDGVLSNIPVFHLAKPVFDADVVISVPKLKTHSGTLFTGAVKNMYGTVPGHRKAKYHREAPDFTDFTRVILDIYMHTKPHLAVMDAVVGMDGNGPSAGNPRELGFLVVGEDGVAVDTVACAAVGINPMSVPTLRQAASVDLGETRLENIEVLGLSVEKPLVEDFVLPSSFVLQGAGFFYRFVLGFTEAEPVIDRVKCSKCRFCEESCPVEAISWEEGPQIAYDKCVSCLCCQELCPRKAVEIVPRHRVGRLMLKMINKFKELTRKTYG